ncbi:hypothetical protein OROMI_016919 [Orobanche minor]
MDMSVDCKLGEMHNQVVEVNVRVEEPGKDNVHNNVFYAEETLLRSELEAMRDCDPLSARHWIILGKIAQPTVHQVEDSYFIVKFKSKAECDTVLRGGPYTLKNHPVLLKPWAVDFDFSKEDLNVVVVWIKLPKLLVVFQGKRILGRIASLIGTPVV